MMENAHIIIPGDKVYIQIDANDQVGIAGEIVSMPCATGDAVIVKNGFGLYYIQQYHLMVRKAPPLTPHEGEEGEHG